MTELREWGALCLTPTPSRKKKNRGTTMVFLASKEVSVLEAPSVPFIPLHNPAIGIVMATLRWHVALTTRSKQGPSAWDERLGHISGSAAVAKKIKKS